MYLGDRGVWLNMNGSDENLLILWVYWPRYIGTWQIVHVLSEPPRPPVGWE